MHAIERMISTTQHRLDADRTALADCIAACLECEQACTSCADACLGEKQVLDLRRCIRLNQDCADICAATARVMSRFFESDAAMTLAQLEACARACATCGAECHRHESHHEHCKVCADACRRCEEQCRSALRACGGTAAA
jgi:hypothetical protein